MLVTSVCLVIAQIAKTCEASSAGQFASAPVARSHDDGQTPLCPLWKLFDASDTNALAVFELLQQNTPIADTDEFAKLERAMSASAFAQPTERCALLCKSG